MQALMKNVSDLLKLNQINLDDTIPLPRAACQQKSYRRNHPSSESVISAKETDGTYFPPQKIFVVITRLERLKNKSTSQYIGNRRSIPKTKKSERVSERLQVIWEIEYFYLFFPFPHYHTCPHPSECDCAGLDQHQGTLWVCNLTELTTASSPEIHPLFTGSFSFFLQESWLSHFLSFQSTAHPPSRHVMSR